MDRPLPSRTLRRRRLGQAYAEQLRAADREDFDQALRVVMARNRRLAEFMRRLAEVVHLPEPDPQDVDLPALLAMLGAMFSAEFRRCGIVWSLALEAAPRVRLDPQLFEQVLINLIKNAYEAVEASGAADRRVTVGLRREGRGLLLWVEDSAGTLADTQRQKVFEPFYSTKRGGQGIGLVLVREILDAHGFAYGIDCRPGQWTRFTITLPLPAGLD